MQNPITPVLKYLSHLQEELCLQLSEEDGGHFSTEHWQRPEGGGGCTRVLKAGSVIEQAGVNFSHVMGESLPPSATLHRPELSNGRFEACGVSAVIHPQNPFVPTAHVNVRFFICRPLNQPPIWWFGGGFDLTPYYPFQEDCVHWHQTARNACEPFGKEVYPKFKSWCDNYFYIKHRQEARGIGGLFFDDLNEWSFEQCFKFIQSIGDHFIKAYRPIMFKRKQTPFSEMERDFQLYRRGRYVEFNLIYDRGTLFGLQSGGRTESILMSLPPVVHWQYDRKNAAGSEEERLLHYLKPRDWLNLPSIEVN